MRITHLTRSLSSIACYCHILRHCPNNKISKNPHIIPYSTLSSFSRWTRQFRMAAESESFSTVTPDAASDEMTKYGFEREEMYKSDLTGTVDPYDRHLFLCYKSHESWPSRVEDSDTDPLPKLLSAALKARKNDITVKTRLTICEVGDDLALSDGDVLVFPEMIMYRGLKDSDVDSFVEDVLVNGKPWPSGVTLTATYVFVCAHNNRDRRCGVCGPVLIKKLREDIESKGLQNQVVVTACSHVGGHKYAGNVIIFSADAEGKISGNWYGYVTPNDVSELIDQQIVKGEIIERIWRGQMGAPAKETKKLEEPKPEELKLANGTNLNNNEKHPQESVTEEKESVGSCCQGANGVSCCRDGNFEEKPVKKGSCGLSCWTGKWEQREILTAVAVVGAVATVAVAYGLYRRSR